MLFQPLRGVTSHLLPNGLRVLLKEERGWPLVSVQAWVGVGSVDEAESEAGLAHVLEHMVFKGTTRHGAAEISRWVESQGGALNAETSKEYTHYYIDLPSAAVHKAVHLMAELLCQATLDKQEWARECPVILEEMKRRNDDAETMAWELLLNWKAIYADVPLLRLRKVIGSLEGNGSLRSHAETVQRFYKTHYSAPNTLVVVVGDFKSRDILKRIRREFSSMPKAPRPVPRPLSELHTEASQKSLKKKVQQAYTIYGFPTPPAAHSDQEALDLLADFFSATDAMRRLVHTLRRRREKARLVDRSTPISRRKDPAFSPSSPNAM